MKRNTDKDYGLQTEFERIVREYKTNIYHGVLHVF